MKIWTHAKDDPNTVSAIVSAPDLPVHIRVSRETERASVTAIAPDDWDFAVVSADLPYSVAVIPQGSGGKWFSRMLEENQANAPQESTTGEPGVTLDLPAGSLITIIDSADVVVEGVDLCLKRPRYGDTGTVDEVLAQ